jgi:hypothetical protein
MDFQIGQTRTPQSVGDSADRQTTRGTMTEQTQPVVDANAAAEPAANAQTNGAGDDLDTLLSQFETETKTAPSPPQTAVVPPELKALADEVNSLKGALSQVSNVSHKADLQGAIKTIRGDLDPGIFDDDLVEAWLDKTARGDERLQRAWLERSAKPKAWEKIQMELGKNFNKRFSKMPDRQVTEDRDAVTAAVRGASTKAPSEQAPNYASLDNAELRAEYRKLGIAPNF